MAKKRNRHIFLWIVGIIILLLVLRSFGVFDGSKSTLAVITPINVYSEVISPYTCPTTDSEKTVQQCEAKTYFECNQGRIEQKVIFRTNGQWIAWDIDGSGLRCYVSGGTTNPICNPNYIKQQTISSDKPVFPGKTFYANSNNVFEQKLNSGGGGYCSENVFTIGSPNVCDMSATATYNPGYTEIIFGNSNVYDCSGTWEILDKYGKVREYKAINNPNNPQLTTWTQNSTPPPFYPEETIKINNLKGLSDLKLLVQTESLEENCGIGNSGVCLSADSLGNSNGYKNCENGKINPLNITWCDTTTGYYCNEGSCQVPFQTKEISITDSSGNIKDGFTKDEDIHVTFRLIGKAGTPIYNVHNGNVKLEFFKLGETSPKTNIIVPYDFSSGQTLSPSIDNPASDGDLGLYYLVISAIYDTSKPAIKLGLENQNQPTYQVSIGSSVSCSIQLQTSITDISTSKLLTNIPILVKLNPRVGGVGSAVLTKSIKVYMNKGTAKETITTLDIPTSEGSSGGAYTYVYNYVTDQPGDIYAKADISDSGVPASCYSTGKVEDMTITTSQYNVGGSCLPSGQHTFFFETLDSLNRQAQVTSTLCVKKPGSGTYCEPISNLVEQVTGGKIGQNQFTYDLVKNVGETAQYTFQLTTHSNEFNRDSVVPDINIEVKDSCVPVECRTTKECQVSKGDTYMCVNGSCVNPSPNWLLYVGIGVVVIILSVAVYFIVRSVTKPKTEVYTGLEGL